MKNWTIFLFFEVVIAALLCFSLAWINLRQINLSYEISNLQKVLGEKRQLHSKLIVEKSFLFSPARLKRLGDKFNFSMPSPDRIREIR